jgi:hypothetical protein
MLILLSNGIPELKKSVYEQLMLMLLSKYINVFIRLEQNEQQEVSFLVSRLINQDFLVNTPLVPNVAFIVSQLSYEMVSG